MNIDGKISALIGAVVLVFLITALAPDMFAQVTQMGNESDVPSWVSTVFGVMIGAGLVFIIWRVFSKK